MGMTIPHNKVRVGVRVGVAFRVRVRVRVGLGLGLGWYSRADLLLTLFLGV